MATAKQLDDITECAICTQVYTDPRVLPCGHTYCLKCIEAWTKDKQPGDEVACPLCRKQFTLPSNGVSDLPKNFFVNNFLQMKELWSVESNTSPCEACSGDGESESGVQNVAGHNGHKCSDVNEVRDDFCRQKRSDIDSVSAGVEKCRGMLESLEKEKEEFIQQVKRAGVEINAKAEMLKRMIDDHKNKLMKELSSLKHKKMQEIESLQEKIESQLMSMKKYKKYVDKVRQKSETACDIARAASALHERTEELLTFDVIERTVADLGHAGVTFTPSDQVIDDVSKTIGHLKLNVPGNSTIK